MNYTDLLAIFNLKDIEQLIFRLLVEHGPLKVTQIARLACINRTSAYDYLRNLLEKGLINQTYKNEVKIFLPQSLDSIKFILTEKAEKVVLAQDSIYQLEKVYEKKHAFFKPRFTLYESKEEIRQMMKDVLLCDDITVLAYWPIKKILEILGVDFFREFQSKRLKSNIYLKTIWPPNQVPNFDKYPFLYPKPELKREVRPAPDNIDYSLGYTIYNNSVRSLSSDKENYGFLVESKEFSETMRSQFNLIWNISRPISKSIEKKAS